MAEHKTTASRHETVLDVTEERLARTYAQALLGASGGNGDAGASVEELEAIVGEMLLPHPQLGETLCSAFLDEEQRRAMIDRLMGGRVSPTVLNFVKVLSDHGRIGILSSVAREARKLYNSSAGRADVLVKLAMPADDALLDEIASIVRQHAKVEPVMRVEIDPAIVGGFEIRVGDVVYDGSLRTAFAKAHKEIVRQTIEAIETNPQRFTLAG
jgi:F-type H+-transporting ATPase subunit delta